MGKEVKLNPKQGNEINEVIEKVKEAKRSFIAPKKRMKESIENDAQYLMALSDFINAAQKKVEFYRKQGAIYEASKIQVEIFDAIGKFQSNQGLVNDKSLHYEKVFLPRYEKELEESSANFDGMLNQCKELLSNMKGVENKIVGFIEKEVSEYEASSITGDEEYKNHIYKILKRLFNKFQEDAANAGK